ncbi:MAG TPA: hypothetical protein DD412_01690 [Holosporales bacterium]|nr:hypothetical protein [Holosporales bacterium]
MSNTKSNHLAEIISLMQRYKISLADIDAYGKGQSAPLKETPRFIVFLAYLGGLLVLGGLGIYLKDHWENFLSVERIVMTYGVGLSLYILALLLYKKGTSTLALSNFFVIAFLFQGGGLGVALHELFPDGDNLPLFVLTISTLMLFQAMVTFYKVPLISVLFMGFYYLAFTYSALIAYLLNEMLIPEKLIGQAASVDFLTMLGGVALIALVYKVQRTPYRAICGFWYFVAMVAFYGGAYMLFKGVHYPEFFGFAPLFGLLLTQITRSKAMLTLTAIAFIGYLGDMTAHYFLDTPWWPIALVVMGLMTILIAVLSYRRAQSYK